MISAKDELRCFLGGPPDEIEVRELGDNKFIASVRISMFQKRMRITQKVGAMEFVAGGMWSLALSSLLAMMCGSISIPAGRIWWLHFDIHGERWRVMWGLAQDSFPARPNAVLQIKAHRRKPRWNLVLGTLPPLRMNWISPKDASRTANFSSLNDWLMDK